MIYFLEGHIFDIEEDFIALKTNTLTYQVYMPKRKNKILEINQALSLYIYHHIREDTQLLFGFTNKEERRFFTLLTSVSGIGPKLALKLLSQADVNTLIKTILSQDISSLTNYTGVGKKGAERLIIELKDKIPTLFNTDALSLTKIETNNALDQLSEDLNLALKTLGYHQDEIKKGIEKAKTGLSPNMNLQDSIKFVLSQMNT